MLATQQGYNFTSPISIASRTDYKISPEQTYTVCETGKNLQASSLFLNAEETFTNAKSCFFPANVIETHN